MRWKLFIPFMVIVALVVSFNILFFDLMAKSAMISVGENIFEAKVEIDAFKTSFINLSVNVKGMAIANKDNVWVNLYEIGDVSFKLDPKALLEKKFVVENMSLDGLTWNTKRSFSGALSPKKLKKIRTKKAKDDNDSESGSMFSSLRKKAEGKLSKMPSFDGLDGLDKNLKNISIDSLIDESSLSSLKQMDDISEKMNKKYSKLSEEASNIDVSGRLKPVNEAVNSLKGAGINSPEDITSLKNKIDTLKNSTNIAKEELEKINNLKSGALGEMGTENEILSKINELKQSDYAGIASKLKLPEMDFKNIAPSILGPSIMSKYETVLSYIELSRKYLPSKKKKEDKVIKQRSLGSDIEFPKEKKYPGVLIKNISISGESPEVSGQNTQMHFSGVIKDVTSDPALLGRPVVVRISGNEGSKSILISGVFDHRKEVPKDALTVKIEGLTPEEVGIPKSSVMPEIRTADTSLIGNFELTGGSIDSLFKLSLNKIVFDKKSKDSGSNALSVNEIWEGVDNIDVRALIKGIGPNINVSITSNLDSILKERFSDIYGKKFKEIQDKIKGRIDELTGKRKKELLDNLSSNRDGIEKQYAGKQEELSSGVKSAENTVKEKENMINDYKDKEKKKLDEEKKKAEDNLKKEAGDKIQNLFK